MSVGFRTTRDANRVIAGIRRIEQIQTSGGHIPSLSSSGGGGIAPNLVIGTITAKSGTSHATRYSVRGDTNPDIVVTFGEPLIRRVPSDLDIDTPAVGEKAILYYDNEDSTWKIWSVDEVIQTASCSQTAGTGSGTSGITTPTEDGFKGQQNTTLSLTSFTKSVTSGTQTKQSQLVYTFPSGWIFAGAVGLFLRASAPSCTNSVRVSLGTTAASGSGTTLTGTDANIMSQQTLGTLTSSGVDFSKAVATVACADGTSSAITLYVNFAPSANWNATDTITFAQPPTADHALRMLWTNMGDI